MIILWLNRWNSHLLVCCWKMCQSVWHVANLESYISLHFTSLMRTFIKMYVEHTCKLLGVTYVCCLFVFPACLFLNWSSSRRRRREGVRERKWKEKQHWLLTKVLLKAMIVGTLGVIALNFTRWLLSLHVYSAFTQVKSQNLPHTRNLHFKKVNS